MAEKIVIAELQLNTKSLQDSSTMLIQEIGKLRAQQKELSKDTKGLSEATEEQSRRFIENDARLKQLNSEYANNKRVLAEATTGVEGLNDLLSQEISRVGDAEQANKKLSLIRSQITTDTQAGRDAIEEINGKIDQNNDFIKENADQLKKQKIGIGDYKTGIKEAIAETDLFSGQLGDVTQVFNNFSPVFNTLNQDIKNTINQMNVFGKSNDDAATATDQNTQSTLALSSGKKALAVATNLGTGALRLFTLALAATGIGLIIVAVGLLIGYFRTFTPIIDKVEQGMAAFGAAIKVVQQALTSLLSGGGLTMFKTMGDDMSKAAEEAIKLTKAQQDLDDALEMQEITSSKTRAEINRLNIQAKDRTKSESERLKMLEQASRLEDQDFKQRKINVEESLKIAEQRIKNEAKLTDTEFSELKKRGFAYKEFVETRTNNTDELFNSLKKAILDNTALENEFYSNQEKNINKQNKLIDDSQEKAQKAQADAQKREDDAIARQKENNDKKIQMMNEELSLFIAKENIKTKTLQDSAVYEETLVKKRLDLLDKELEFKKISQTKYEEEKLNIVNESGKKQLENFANNARAEFDLFIQENQTKLEAGKLLSQQLINEEVRRLDSIRIEKLNQLEISKQVNAEEVEAKRANNEALTIAETEFLTAKNAIELEYKTQSIANQKALDDQVKEQKLNQLLADRELAVINSATQLEQDLLLAQQGYDAELVLLQEKLKKEFLTQEQFDAKVLASQKNLQNQKNLIKADELKRTTDLYVGLGNAAQGLFGKNKALTTALALADTYASANKAYYSQFLPIPTVDSPVRGAIAAGTAVLGGLANVAQINNIKFEKGGLQEIGGNRHSTGGTKFVGEDGTRFEAEQGEIIGVMNRNAARAFMEFNNAYPSGATVSTPNVFASGGFVDQNIASSNSIIDYDLLAAKVGYNVGQANANLPTPMVAITDINYGQKDYAYVVNGANF